MITIDTVTIDPRMAVDRTDSARHRAAQLERRIGKAQMTAALESDWDQIHIRSRAMRKQLTRMTDPLRQIAAVRRIRRALHQENDTLGLRALRLATAGAMVPWLGDEATQAEARALGRLFAADQRRGIPGMADLERQLERARRLIRPDERSGEASSLPGPGSKQGQL